VPVLHLHPPRILDDFALFLGEDVAASEEDDTIPYLVVINDEGQHSIWPKHKDIPKGWRSVGKEGRKAECLNYIDEVWTDMSPRSLRRKMEGGSRKKKP
jgi:MbtH protein